MNSILENSLYKKQEKRFEIMNDLSKQFASVYCGTTILRESVFGVVENYARKKDILLEILRYPFRDDELWAFTFVKQGTIFLCVNAELSMCKQIFAVAHELYHIQCYVEQKEEGIIKSGSLLDAKTVDDAAKTQEDLEANAFAGLLLMPDARVQEQVCLLGLKGRCMNVDDILKLMELFALPYKAVILRLYEGQVISEKRANALLEYDKTYVNRRIELTGKAMQWKQNCREITYLGSLLDNLEFNSENEFITESREKSDREYLQKLKREFRIERQEII